MMGASDVGELEVAVYHDICLYWNVTMPQCQLTPSLFTMSDLNFCIDFVLLSLAVCTRSCILIIMTPTTCH